MAQTSATPRAWPTAIAVRTFLLKNSSSKAVACGRSSPSNASSCSASTRKRCGSLRLAGVFSVPQVIKESRPVCRRTAPYPVSASPGSTPRTSRPSLDTLADALHHVGGHIDVRVDRLHIVVFLEGIHQLAHRWGRRLVERNQLRGVHRHLRRIDLVALLFERLLHTFELCRIGDDVDRLAVDAGVARSDLDRLQADLIRVLAVCIDDDLTLAGEHPAHAPGRPEISAGAGEQVANVAAGAVAVVRHGLDHDGDAVRAVSFEAKLLHLGAAEVARAALDRPLDVLLRHVDITGLLDRESQPVVTVWIPATFASRDRDLARHLGELLTFLRVGEGLLVLDRRPFRVSGHLLPVGSLAHLQPYDAMIAATQQPAVLWSDGPVDGFDDAIVDRQTLLGGKASSLTLAADQPGFEKQFRTRALAGTDLDRLRFG